jgi:hypothetical protein
MYRIPANQISRVSANDANRTDLIDSSQHQHRASSAQLRDLNTPNDNKQIAAIGQSNGARIAHSSRKSSSRIG